jgi:hypothetical protein
MREGKIDHCLTNLNPLIEDGKKQAHEFLKARKRVLEHAVSTLFEPVPTTGPLL